MRAGYRAASCGIDDPGRPVPGHGLAPPRSGSGAQPGFSSSAQPPYHAIPVIGAGLTAEVRPGVSIHARRGRSRCNEAGDDPNHVGIECIRFRRTGSGEGVGRPRPTDSTGEQVTYQDSALQQFLFGPAQEAAVQLASRAGAPGAADP